MNIVLKGRPIPTNENGDPKFSTITHVRTIFTDEEITEMVNRYLYQATYQQMSHLKRAKERAERLKPIREYLRKTFNTTYDKATSQQIKQAEQNLKKD